MDVYLCVNYSRYANFERWHSDSSILHIAVQFHLKNIRIHKWNGEENIRPVDFDAYKWNPTIFEYANDIEIEMWTIAGKLDFFSHD